MDPFAPPQVPNLDDQHVDQLSAALRAEITMSTRSPHISRFALRAGIAVTAACMIAFALTLTVVSRHTSPADRAGGAAPASGPSIRMASPPAGGPLIRMASPPAALRSSLISQCKDGFRLIPGQPPAGDGGPVYPTFWKDASPVLVNTYAGYSSVLLLDGDVWASCVIGRGSVLNRDSHPPTQSATRPAGSGVLPLAFSDLFNTRNFASGHTVWLTGRAGPNVAQLIIHLHNGQNVDAVISPDGWWQAWAAPQETLVAPQSKAHPDAVINNYNTSVTATIIDKTGHATHQRLSF